MWALVYETVFVVFLPVCLVELKAHFDERRNIGWARALEESGAHVVHGLPGLKTHAKIAL